MKVELLEKFNLSCGTVLLIKSNVILNVGEKIQADGEEYIIKGFMHPAGFHDDEIISVIV